MSKPKLRHRHGQGASLVEGALSLPLFILIVFSFIELVRMFLIWTILNYSLQMGMNTATRILFDTDAGNIITTQSEIDALRDKIYAIEARVQNQLRRFGILNLSQTNPRRITFTEYECDRTGVERFRLRVAILRPGESCTDLTTNQVLAHPTRPDPIRAPGYSPGETMASLMLIHPVSLYMNVTVSPMTSFLPAQTFLISAHGFQMGGRYSPSLFNTIPGGSPPTPTPTVTITPTPSASGSMTPTATPTATPECPAICRADPLGRCPGRCNQLSQCIMCGVGS